MKHDEAKQQLASSMIEKVLTENTLFVDMIQDIPSATATQKSYSLCRDLGFCRDINDAVHLKTAEAHCDKLVTFERDFKRFIPYTSLEIEILD